MNKADIFAVFRRLRILFFLSQMRYYFQKMSRKKRNDAFKKKHPEVKLPPDYLIYESFHLDYAKYYLDGEDTAKWLINLLSQYTRLENVRILDWGCGPGRIIRHLPALLASSCGIFGTDYNPNSIKWCSEHIPKVRFSLNRINPPLNFEEDHFDVIYGISIFTHLSERSHADWARELRRVAKKGALLMFTTHGESFKHLLSTKELKKFNEGQLIIRDQVKEGHKIFGAFHPPSFMRSFFEKYFTVVDHVPGKEDREQDIWILNKDPLS